MNLLPEGNRLLLPNHYPDRAYLIKKAPFTRSKGSFRYRGASCRDRTSDLLITSQLLYQLS